jgi:Arylsulfotransferase (ASST)
MIRLNTRTASARSPRWKRVSFWLLLGGVAALGYLLGAAAILLDLPTSTFLRRAFVGGATWYYQKRWSEQRRLARSLQEAFPPVHVGPINKTDRTCDGFTLCMYGADCHAVLINMRGDVVHQWHTPFGCIWPEPPHLRGPIDDADAFFNDGHVYPNGDLLVVLEGTDLKNAMEGYGLARLDWNSRVLWKYAGNCHHDVDVGDDGRVYAIAHALADRAPAGLEYTPTPCLVDFIDILSPDGRRLKRISLLEAFQNSPYAPLLSALERPHSWEGLHRLLSTPELVDDLRRRDVLHTNAIKVLNTRLAPRFPMFKAGQLLISMRHLNAIAMLDPESGKIVWAARGPWQDQHDPTFLGNGHLLLFDNQGSPRSSRVLEYDPRSQAFSWSYPDGKGARFLSQVRGMSQRLANGNTLIVNSDGGEAFEVTADHELVWSCSCGTELYRARRYTADQLPFLSGDQRARPQ